MPTYSRPRCACVDSTGCWTPRWPLRCQLHARCRPSIQDPQNPTPWRVAPWIRPRIHKVLSVGRPGWVCSTLRCQLSCACSIRLHDENLGTAVIPGKHFTAKSDVCAVWREHRIAVICCVVGVTPRNVKNRTLRRQPGGCPSSTAWPRSPAEARGGVSAGRTELLERARVLELPCASRAALTAVPHAVAPRT